MENGILHIPDISDYNKLLGIETLHPLVSVINLSEARRIRHRRHTFGFYAIFLKDVKCGDLIYGRRHYDYQEGTVVCLAPGQTIGIDDNGETFQPKGWALCFHPDFIRGTALGKTIREYTYFSYEVSEALHLSQKERTVFVDCLEKIRHELGNRADRLSRRLITANIGLLLDYCLRFYERQFITREVVNHDIHTRFEALLNDYFDSDKAKTHGLPSVKMCADKLCLSPNYFGDLIKKETGKTPQEHIRLKLTDLAKDLILSTDYTIARIAYELGFRYPQHLTRMFKKTTGLTPNQYKRLNTIV